MVRDNVNDYGGSILCRSRSSFVVVSRTQSHPKTTQKLTESCGLSTSTRCSFLIAAIESPLNCRDSWLQPSVCYMLATRIQRTRPCGIVAWQEHRSATKDRCGFSGSISSCYRTGSTGFRLSFHPLVGGFARPTSASQAARGCQLLDRIQYTQTSWVSLWSTQAGFEASSGPKRREKGQKTEESRFKKTKASSGRCAFVYCDEAEFHLNPGLSRCWGHLKRSAIHNYYFETVENLEKAIMKAVKNAEPTENHPLRLHLQTAQNLLKAA